MPDRESILPLVSSLLLAVALHVGAIAGYGVVGAQAAPDPAKPPHDPPARPDLTPLGITPDTATLPPELLPPQPAGEPSPASPRDPVTPLPIDHPILFNARLHNDSDVPVATPFTIEWFIDGRSVQRRLVTEAIAPGSTLLDTLTRLERQPGLHTLRVVVDSENAIDESRENNNLFETAFLWVAPPPPAGDDETTTSISDLAVAAIDVPEPRVAGAQAKVIARLVNLGAGVDETVRLAVLVDGRLLTQGEVAGGIGARTVADVELPFTVLEPGEHEVTVIVDPARAIADADLTNNRLSRTFDFEDPHRKIQVGQIEPSPVQMNWIAYEDYQELLARQSKFDQATAQQVTDPVPVEQTPLDPTPPAPRPSPPTKPSVKPQPEVETQPRSVVEPTPEPQKPAQPKPPTEVTQRETKQPIAIPGAKPGPASAPLEKPEPTPAGQIDPTPERGTTPQPVVDKTPSQSPDPTTPVKPTTPSREVAVVTPPVERNPKPDAVLPEPSPASETMRDKLEARGPDAKPDPKSDAPNLSDLVESALKEPLVPASPLPAQPGAPASPVERAEPTKEPAREPEANDRPVDRIVKPVDGAEPRPDKPETKPEAAQQPARPTTPGQPSQPTAAPRDNREVPPVTRLETVNVRPGRVVARTGIKINTALPRPDPITARTIIARNPSAVITFDKSGHVINVQITRSAGSAAWDAAILNSLYRYTAEGPLLNDIGRSLDVPINLIFSD